MREGENGQSNSYSPASLPSDLHFAQHAACTGQLALLLPALLLGTGCCRLCCSFLSAYLGLCTKVLLSKSCFDFGNGEVMGSLPSLQIWD